jgi:sterol-4alpha-carboxylate 3-dehydrogenase (decarboxylating)
MDVLKSGKTAFQVGSNENLFDWTYVDNVVHAHLIASERLHLTVPLSELDARTPPVDLTVPRRQLPTSVFRPDSLLDKEIELNPDFKNETESDSALLAARNRFDQYYPDSTSLIASLPNYDPVTESVPIAGEAYFITNGEPVPFWDFPRAVWAAYNGHEPKRRVVLPAFVGLALAGLGESVMGVLGKTPNLTRGKVVYSTVNRYYNVEKVCLVCFLFPALLLSPALSADFDFRAGPSYSRLRTHRRC